MQNDKQRPVFDPRIAVIFHIVNKNLNATADDYNKVVNLLSAIDVELEALKSPKNEPRKDS